MSLSQEDKHIALEQYRIYCTMKENFVDRNFGTNKYYISVLIVLFVAMYITQDISFEFNISAIMINCLIGMGICFFWWSNVDSYDTLIKIKLKSVIDEIEKVLPIQPHLLEKEGFMEFRKQKKGYIFSDVQKGMALGMFIMFMVLFLIEFIPFFFEAFNISLI